MTIPQAYQLERPRGAPFSKRKGPSSYAAVEQETNRERWRQHDRHGGRNGGSGESGGSGGGGGSAVVSAALADSPSINANATINCGSRSEGNKGSGAGACAANGDEGIDGRGKQVRRELWYEPPPAAAVVEAAAAAGERSGGAVADLDGLVSTSGNVGDGSTRGHADGMGGIGVGEVCAGEACWEDGGTTAGLEGAEGAQPSPPSPSPFKVRWILRPC